MFFTAFELTVLKCVRYDVITFTVTLSICCQNFTFYLEKMPYGAPNSSIPLLVRVKMSNFDVHHILVNKGSSVDVMYTHLFCTLKLDDTHMS